MREAISEYAIRAEKLSASERQRMLALLDRAIRRPPSRAPGDVALELKELRVARRRWGARHRAARAG